MSFPVACSSRSEVERFRLVLPARMLCFSRLIVAKKAFRCAKKSAWFPKKAFFLVNLPFALRRIGPLAGARPSLTMPTLAVLIPGDCYSHGVPLDGRPRVVTSAATTDSRGGSPHRFAKPRPPCYNPASWGAAIGLAMVAERKAWVLRIRVTDGCHGLCCRALPRHGGGA